MLPKKPVRASLVILCLLLPTIGRAEFYNEWATNNLSSVPSQSSPTNDPDSDGFSNLAEFAFGTNPLLSNGGSPLIPRITNSNGMYVVEIFEQSGHRPGVQIDLDATADMTHWIRPWWLRQLTNSLPGDPPNSVREVFTTWLPGTNAFIIRGVVKLFDSGPEKATYYVATNGNDNAAGTSTNAPFKSLSKAVSLATTGNLIYVRGGTYSVSNKLVFTKSGSPSQPIRLRAYPGELPIFDESLTNIDCLVISGNCWQVYGLMFTNAGHNAIRIMRDSNIVERCVSYGARNTGFHIAGDQNVPGTMFPASNLIVNCDSIRSYDAPTGGNADGFSAKWNIGPNNVFLGCRAWENSDDGWDLWMATSTVLIKNCWAFRAAINVPVAGDGNGFKLGGNYVATPHRIVGCLSFGNRVRGYDQNNNMGTLTVDNNVAWNNPSYNFSLNHPNTSTPHVVRNNLAVGTGVNDVRAGSVLLSNSWQAFTSPVPGTNDFLNTDVSWAIAPRRDDGGLPETPFLRLLPGGRFQDQGVNVGDPFVGAAPDLGAYESLVW